MPRELESKRYEDWMEKIQERESSLKRRSDDWDKYLRKYRMEQKREEIAKGDPIVINFQFALSRIILPSIYYKNPDVLVSPRRDTPLPYAVLLEKLLNYQLEEIRFKREMRKVIFDTLFCGLGVMKFGYGPALKNRPKTKVDEFAAVGEESLFDENLWEGGAPKFDEGVEYDQRITDYCPFAIRVSPKYFLIDRLATDISTARWVCHRILKPVEEVKKSKLYTRALTSGIEGNVRLSDEKYLNEADGATWDYRRRGKKAIAFEDLVILYEVWDRERDELLVLDSHNMDKGQKQFLRREDNPYEIEGFPFELLCFNPDPEDIYGVSDASAWHNPTDALNLLYSMRFNHVKRFNRKYAVKKGAVPPDEMDKLQSPVDGTIVLVDGEPSQDIYPIPDAPISGDLYNLQGDLKQELTVISGVTEQRKGTPEKTKTATEASIIESHAQVSDNDRLDQVSDFVLNSVKKILQLDKQFLDPEYIAFLESPELAQFWQETSEEVLRSEVDVKILIGSSAFTSREVRAKLLLDFLNLTAPLIDHRTGGPVVDVYAIVKRAAEALAIPDPESLLMPQLPGVGQGAPATQGGEAGAPGRAGRQSVTRRGGAPNLGDLISGVQNLGVRRTPPNPTKELAR